MAEIGLIASIFGVAAFGTKVATTLYETGDVMIHAHQQIASMAKHVSQFSAVLRHVGRVLETEKGSCSKDLLRDVRKIKRSSKATFKEINSTLRRTLKSKRFRRVRWLFEKSKAKELEARLDSEQSTLQTMIQSVIVSSMQSRSKGDSEKLSTLREEIACLKTLIVENYNNVTNLQQAEESTEAEVQRPSDPMRDDDQEWPLDDSETLISSSPPPRLLYDSSLSDTDEEGSGPDGTANNVKSTQSQHQDEQGNVEYSAGNAQTSSDNQATAVQPLAANGNSFKPGMHRASALLLQMVPYRPTASNSRHLNPSNSLIYDVSRSSKNIDTNPEPVMEEATKSVRLLLDKWTTSGSAPVSDLLVDKGKASTEFRRREPNFSRQREPRRPYSPMIEFSDDDFNSSNFPQPRYQDDWPPPPLRAEPRPIPGQPPQGNFHPHSKDTWITSRAPGHRPTRIVGDEILNALRSTGGGIVYTKRNDFRHSYYVDHILTYTFNLVPSTLITSNESEPRFTEIGKGWVRQEALELLSYTYTETPSGHFCISGNLELNEIEELVRLSYQAVERSLVERSRQIIDERGWRETVNNLNRGIPNVYMNPSPASAYNQANESWNQRSDPYAHRPGPHYNYYNYETPRRTQSRSDNYYNYETPRRTQSRSDPVRLPRTISPQKRAIPMEIAIRNSEAQLVKVNDKREIKSAAPEVRFTLPRAEFNGQPSPKPDINAREGDRIRKERRREKELKEAREKLELLKTKRDEAEKANNLVLAADLQYYVIPEIDERIRKLVHDQKEDEDDNPAQQKTHAPRTEIETENEETDGSENGSTVQDPNLDLYE